MQLLEQHIKKEMEIISKYHNQHSVAFLSYAVFLTLLIPRLRDF